MYVICFTGSDDRKKSWLTLDHGWCSHPSAALKFTDRNDARFMIFNLPNATIRNNCTIEEI